MAPNTQGSVSGWIAGLKRGESSAAHELWDRYFAQLMPIAVNRLSSGFPTEDGEDVALSALKSVMIGIRDNRFPALTDRDGLWSLLLTVTARKSIIEMRRQRARKRAISLEVRLSDVQEYIGRASIAQFAVEFADTLDHLVRKLRDPALRLVVQRKLSGFTTKEIADDLGCSMRTVIRKLKLIRQEWAAADLDSPAR
jgi:RNA polymerase sigma factor (sigma-70 family)